MMKNLSLLIVILFLSVCSCKKPVDDLKDRSSQMAKNVLKNKNLNATKKPPLYWSPYEYHIVLEHEGQPSNHMPESEWQANIDWVAQHLKSYGYNMVCIDGWGDDNTFNEDGYRTTHSSEWTHDYAWWSDYLQQRGMTLGMYNNPLWVIQAAADAGTLIKGTDIPLASIIDTSENALWFKWVQVNRPGAEEYVKGYIQYYADMGVKYFRVDFLSWFEDGHDQNLGAVGPSRPKADYEKALRWMQEACEENGMFLSLVMPHLKNEGELEERYGDMIRINDDAGYDSDWNRFSNLNRGQRNVDEWSQYDNTFDGYTYWSKLSGRGKLILDGDFIRLNKLANDHERKSVISLHTVAGGPISVSDQYHSIGNHLWLYQNEELLALHEDGFVGKPLSNDPTNEASQIWTGQLGNGDWIVALFNRENTEQARSIDFALLNIAGNAQVRDLWEHTDVGSMQAYSADIPAHGVKVLKVVADTTAGELIESGAAYSIINRNSNKVLDVFEQSTVNGAIIHQWENAATESQGWQISSNGDGSYSIRNLNSNKNLDVFQQQTADDVAIHQWESSSSASQRWRIWPVGDDYFRIENVNSNKALDVYGFSSDNGAAVKQFIYTGGLNQQWRLAKLP